MSWRCGKRAVKSCVGGRRGQRVRLVAVQSQERGGKIGQRYLLEVDSLPAELQQRAFELFPELAVAPAGRSAGPGKRGKDRKPRVLVGRAWDSGIDLPPAAKVEITAELDRKVRSLWASPAQRAGWRTVARFAAIDLFDLSRTAGSELSDEALRQLCEVPRRFICDWSRRRHRKTETFRSEEHTSEERRVGKE